MSFMPTRLTSRLIPRLAPGPSIRLVLPQYRLGALGLTFGLMLAACGPGDGANLRSEVIDLPRTIAWSAYPTGTGGYSQAVAIGSILQRDYGVNLRVVPGRNDVSRLATLRAGRVHFSAGGSEAVYAQEGILNFADTDRGAGRGDCSRRCCRRRRHCVRS